MVILTSHRVSQKALKHIIQSSHSHLSMDPMPKEVVSRNHSALSLPHLRTTDRESCTPLTGVHSGTSIAENSFAGTSPEKIRSLQPNNPTCSACSGKPLHVCTRRLQKKVQSPSDCTCSKQEVTQIQQWHGQSVVFIQ